MSTWTFRRKPRRRWFRRLILTLMALLLLSALPVLALRWIDPPTSAFMLAWSADESDGERDVRYEWVDADVISPHLLIALVAAEDQRFTTHHGFDVDAIRDALDERRSGEGSRGASTISQQTAKNLFLWSGRSWVRKGLEVYYTVLIEALWPKPRILEVYANIAEFGDGIYGAEAAAQHYFRIPATQIDPAQGAMLAAVLPNPKRLRVDQPSSYVLRRQQWIQQQARQLGGPAHLSSAH